MHADFFEAWSYSKHRRHSALCTVFTSEEAQVPSLAPEKLCIQLKPDKQLSTFTSVVLRLVLQEHRLAADRDPLEELRNNIVA